MLEILERPGVLENAKAMSDALGRGLDAIRERHPLLVEIRRNGLVMGLRFGHEMAGPMLTASGWEAGLWAFFAGYDRSVLQFKPGLLLRPEDCDEVLGLLEETIARCEARIARG